MAASSTSSGLNTNRHFSSGDETELDRSIVDKISDPLIHMVRNSIDHGIEAEQDRLKSGKNPTGNLELRAFHQAGNIVIEIEDDGKGFAPGEEEKIFRRFYKGSAGNTGLGLSIAMAIARSHGGTINAWNASGHGAVFEIILPIKNSGLVSE